MLSDEQIRELKQGGNAVNPAMLTHDITRLQCMLSGLAKAKKDDLVLEAEAAKKRRLKKQQGSVKVVALQSH